MLQRPHYYPGVALLLGSLLGHAKAGHPRTLPPEIITPRYLGLQQWEGHILADMGFTEIQRIYSNNIFLNTPEFSTFFAEFLEDPERSNMHVFDQQRYTTASKESLQLCLCNHHNFSKGTMESAHRDKVLCRSKPWLWRRRLGVHSRTGKGRYHIKVH